MIAKGGEQLARAAVFRQSRRLAVLLSLLLAVTQAAAQEPKAAVEESKAAAPGRQLDATNPSPPAKTSDPGTADAIVPRKIGTPLWQLLPFDIIEIINKKTFDIDAVRIAPGTQVNTKEDEYVGIPGLPPRQEILRNSFYRIRLKDDDQEYYVLGKYIVSIRYYDDMVIEEARRAARAGNWDLAYRSLETVQDRDPEWPGLLDARIAVLAEEVGANVQRADWEKAYWLLAEEHRLRQERAAKAGGSAAALTSSLANHLEVIAKGWVQRQIDRRDLAEGRKIIARVERLRPDSPAAATWRAHFAREAQRLIRQADEEVANGKLRPAYSSLIEAVNWTPDAPVVRSAIEKYFAEHALLRVGVTRLPTFRSGPAHWSAADWRVSEAINLALMTRVAEGDDQRFDSQIVESLDLGNVNKRATVTLRQGLRWPFDKKPVTVIDVHRLLLMSREPGTPLYHPGLERILANIEPEMPDQLHIDFSRRQATPGVWLQMPFIRVGGLASEKSKSLAFGGLGPFQLAELNDSRCYLTANLVYYQPDKPLIRQLEETRLANAAWQLRALEKREIDLVADLPPRYLDYAKKIADTRVVTLAHPRVHLLQFNWNRREIRHRTFRRAVDYAIDRKRVFERVGQPNDEANRVVTAPLPYGSFGYDKEVAPRPFDRPLARALLLGVKKELESIRPLTLAYSGGEDSRIACTTIAEDLRAVGLDVTVVEFDERNTNDPAAADIRYQTISVSEPMYDLLTLLTRDNPGLSRHLSAWMQQLMTRLIQVPGVAAARQLLPELHRAIHDEVIVLPLWQWQEHAVVANNVEGMPESPATLYGTLADWKVRPVYPESQWEKPKAVAAGGN